MKKIKEFYGYKIHGPLYRFTMRLAHKYNWHYAPPIYPDGDTMLWCKWCGFREVIKRRNEPMGLSEYANKTNVARSTNKRY